MISQWVAGGNGCAGALYWPGYHEAGNIMPTTFFLVRAVVAPQLREKFDRWYATEHLPDACRAFNCEKAWRGWSSAEEGVHYAVYQFADKAACDAALSSAEFKALVAEFTRSWPEGVTRTRDVVTVAEEWGG
jgi:hypothetical protein